MAINFAAASTAGLNNPGTEIITLVKDGSGNFINPPSYDKIRAYLRSGEVPMLFVTTEGGETGSLYQLAAYSETKNKIRFSNDVNVIEFSAGVAAPVVSDVVPKPLTYDYMPEGYPKKETGTVTVMEEQELAFTPGEEGAPSTCYPANSFEIVEGQTYRVNWDGTEYECIGAELSGTVYYIGNLSIAGETPDSGEPFIYVKPSPGAGYFGTFDTAASHTLSVKTTEDIVTPMATEFLPDISMGGVTTLHINVTGMDFGTGAPIFTADKTPTEMAQAAINSPVWCVVSFTAGILSEEAVSIGVPPGWTGGRLAFGMAISRTHTSDSNNDIAYAVSEKNPDTWDVEVAAFTS